MEKKDDKILVEFNGRMIRMMPHTIKLAEELGAVVVKKVIKETPKELIKAEPVKIEKTEASPLPEMKISTEPKSFEKPARKKPVKSKT
jgi:hypothetical protein